MSFAAKTSWIKEVWVNHIGNFEAPQRWKEAINAETQTPTLAQYGWLNEISACKSATSIHRSFIVVILYVQYITLSRSVHGVEKSFSALRLGLGYFSWQPKSNIICIFFLFWFEDTGSLQLIFIVLPSLLSNCELRGVYSTQFGS